MLTIKAGTVMLSAAKHLCAHPDRPFAEFTLSGAHVLRVTSEGSGDERCPSGRSQATPDYYRSRSLTFFIGQWPIDALPRPINRRCGHKCTAYDMAGFGLESSYSLSHRDS